MKLTYYIFLLSIVVSCLERQEKTTLDNKQPLIVVLGNAQDAGYPQIACQKECCQSVEKNPKNKRLVSSIALIDPLTNQSWMFDASPDLTAQTKILSKHLKENKQLPDGIFLTHGHIGHYTGLMFLGKEAFNSQKLPVYAMPRMQDYLTNNGPWSQLVQLENIALQTLQKDSTMVLNNRLEVTPILVPHRDEFTETVGFLIKSQDKKALFIPDIDKWSKWQSSITDYIKQVDIAILDATFFKNGEIDREMDQVPHPFVEESMLLFKDLSKADKSKVYFIHFNHTNPLLQQGSEAHKVVLKKGFKIAEQGLVIPF